MYKQIFAVMTAFFLLVMPAKSVEVYVMPDLSGSMKYDFNGKRIYGSSEAQRISTLKHSLERLVAELAHSLPELMLSIIPWNKEVLEPVLLHVSVQDTGRISEAVRAIEMPTSDVATYLATSLKSVHGLEEGQNPAFCRIYLVYTDKTPDDQSMMSQVIGDIISTDSALGIYLVPTSMTFFEINIFKDVSSSPLYRVTKSDSIPVVFILKEFIEALPEECWALF